jgi:hypothetical protein
MGQFAKWLLHEDQKELFDYLFAIVFNLVFVVVAALLLWPLGKTTMVFSLAEGYWIFWTLLIVTASGLVLVQRIFRMDLYSHFDAYVISGLLVSGFVQVGWSAFAAPVVLKAISGTPVWLMVLLYAIGVISCYVASVVVAAFYVGSLYRMANLALAMVSFIVFSLWPAAGRTIYGWFFDLCENL